MPGNERVYNYENVNGVMLYLKMEQISGSTNTTLFTISYTNKENKRSYAKLSLIIAILINILSLCYVRISLTAIAIIIIVFSFLIFFFITHSVQSESLLVIPRVGIQTSVKYILGREDVFIPWSNVDDIIINEVIKLNRVLYYLTVLVKTINLQESEALKLLPVFKYTKPRLAMLETIYSVVQDTLIRENCNGTNIDTNE